MKKSKLYVGISFIISAVTLTAVFVGLLIKSKKSVKPLPIIAAISCVVGAALIWSSASEKAKKEKTKTVSFKNPEKNEAISSSDRGEKIIKSDLSAADVTVPKTNELEYKLNFDVPNEK